MKINLGRCRCGKIIYMVEAVGLRWTADVQSLGAQEALHALLAGRELYEVSLDGQKPDGLSMAHPRTLRALQSAEGEPPVVVGSHECPPGAARRLQTTSVDTRPPPPCPTASGGHTGAFPDLFRPDCNGRSCETCDPVPY